MDSKYSTAGQESDGDAQVMPVLFVGHGSPMNAIEENTFSRTWREVGRRLPRPRAILCVSAHWETWGTLVTAMERPRTIHDFGGFPRPLYEAVYPAPGSPWLANEIRSSAAVTAIGLDEDWGLDHGCWSVLRQMFPNADVPVVQLSLDTTKSPRAHYELSGTLAHLRTMGVLVLGSGNIVHNLRRVVLRGGSMADFNAPFGLEWALEANDLFKRLIDEGRHDELIDYTSLGEAVQLAVPTPEHYLPMLYAIALKRPDDAIRYFNDQAVAGSLTMTSMIIDRAV
jgi:4,5-DOPA dioxygenase extradiol